MTAPRRSLRPTRSLAVMLVGAALLAGPLSAAPASAATTTFGTQADTFVSTKNPTINYGGWDSARISDPQRVTYMRFGVSGLSGTVSRATLRVYSLTASAVGFDVRRVANSTWQEMSVTNETAPAPDATPAATSGPLAASGWVSVDVTSLVAGDGALSVALTGRDLNLISVSTKEAGAAFAAQLVVETATTSPPPPPTEPTVTTSTLTPVADAYVDTSKKRRDRNYGKETVLSVSDSQYRSFLRFDSTALTGDLTKATLRLYGVASGAGFAVRSVSSDSWSETSITGRSYPTYSSTTSATSAAVRQGAWTEVDLTALVQADRVTSIALVAPIASFMSLASRESGANAPQLVVQTQVTPVAPVIVTAGFASQADSFVSTKYPDSNFGTWDTFRASDPQRIGYVKFDVSGLTGPVKKAILRLYPTTASLVGFRVRAVSDSSWTESAITYTTAPAPSSTPVASAGPYAAGAWISLDVTPLVTGNGPVSVAVTGIDAALVTVASRESNNAPQLMVDSESTTGGGGGGGSGGETIIAAAGDIACSPQDPNFNGGLGTSSACRQKATADVIGTIQDLDAVMALGDVQYEPEWEPWPTLDDYMGSYDPTWGRFKSITRPGIGNHESDSYFQYFGAAAGDPAKGYYSYDIGGWHVVMLNSECSSVGGCGAGSPQEVWLRNDLAAHPAACTIGYWHRPSYSSGINGNDTRYGTFWKDLYDAGAEIVLSGHSHMYERYAPMNPSGQVDDARGLRLFVVGTGGEDHSGVTSVQPNSVIRNENTFGVLKLTLRSNGYDWRFLPEAGRSFTDSGTGTCH